MHKTLRLQRAKTAREYAYPLLYMIRSTCNSDSLPSDNHAFMDILVLSSSFLSV